MSSNSLKLRLLLGLVPNHYPKDCPCQHCRCDCHRLRLLQYCTDTQKRRYVDTQIKCTKSTIQTLEKNTKKYYTDIRKRYTKSVVQTLEKDTTSILKLST